MKMESGRAVRIKSSKWDNLNPLRSDGRLLKAFQAKKKKSDFFLFYVYSTKLISYVLYNIYSPDNKKGFIYEEIIRNYLIMVFTRSKIYANTGHFTLYYHLFN